MQRFLESLILPPRVVQLHLDRRQLLRNRAGLAIGGAAAPQKQQLLLLQRVFELPRAVHAPRTGTGGSDPTPYTLTANNGNPAASP